MTPLVSDCTPKKTVHFKEETDKEEKKEGGGGGQEFLILGPIWNLSSAGGLARHLATLRVSAICHKRKALAFPSLGGLRR
jgi:hypothetical protein